jgi:hypothetical protein
MYSKKEKREDVFEKKPKKTSVKPKPKKGEDEQLFAATEGKIKEGGLRKSLKVGDDYKFTIPVLNKLKKHEVGKTFEFEGGKHKMTERMSKQVQLAINMLK